MITALVVMGYVLVGLMVGGGVARFLVGPDPRDPKCGSFDLTPNIAASVMCGLAWPLFILGGALFLLGTALWFPKLVKEWWNKWHNSPEKVKARDERRERREVKRQVNQVAKEYKVKRFRLIRR